MFVLIKTKKKEERNIVLSSETIVPSPTKGKSANVDTILSILPIIENCNNKELTHVLNAISFIISFTHHCES